MFLVIGLKCIQFPLMTEELKVDQCLPALTFSLTKLGPVFESSVSFLIIIGIMSRMRC